jgi:hypothetical protein
MIRFKGPKVRFQSHTQNCVERPQNRHLKPFKRRAELSGQLDPRIKLAGRPKLFTEALAAKKHKDATELACRAGNGGVVPPIEHRFKPGKDWTGNKGGRPKVIGQTLNQRLMEEIEADIPDPKDPKKTIHVKARRLDMVVDTLIGNAMTYQPHSVTAFRTIREIVEPSEEEQRGSSDRDLTRLVVQLLMERKANAQEI